MKPNESQSRAHDAIEWDPPLSIGVRQAGDGPGVLDRYIAARFPGQLRRASDLARLQTVIEAARLYFEEEKKDRSLELLDLAVGQSPAEETLQLARLEIAFLVRDPQLFSFYAREFRRMHPESTAWLEVARLGRAIAPTDAMFGARQGPRAFEHYGPWPHTPNWINAPWDLSSDVLSADYHRAMAEDASASQALPLQEAA